MAFKILDVDKFIAKVHAKLVQNAQSFDRDMNPLPDGLQSKAIFGVTTKDKFKNYGYIDLKSVVIHPLIYDNLSKINTIFNKVINNKSKFVIKNGVLEESEAGGTGLNWLIENWDKIKFSHYRTEKNKVFIDFINNTKRGLIIIDKIPVIPIAYREADTRGRIVKDSDIDSMYKNVLAAVSNGGSFQSAFLEATSKSRVDNIQAQINALYKFFIKNLEAKKGFFRNALAGKRLDSVARMVANARPDIPIDSVAIPWHILLNVFDVFVVAELQKEENEQLSKDLGVDGLYVDEFGDIFDFIYRNVDVYITHHRKKADLWIKTLIKVFNSNPDLKVLLKRDPGWNADSFHCLKPIIRTGVNYEIIINSIYYSPLGGDSFNSNFIINQISGNIISETDEFIIYSGENVEEVNIIQTLETIYRRA